MITRTRMEASISKFIPVQQPEPYNLRCGGMHQPNTSAFKSPDLIELNSDSERNPKPVEPSHYSSSQEEEVETEDEVGGGGGGGSGGGGGGEPNQIHTVEGITDEESCHLLQTEDDSENSDSGGENHFGRSSGSSASNSSYSSGGGTLSDTGGGGGGGGGGTQHNDIPTSKKHALRKGTKDNYWDMTAEQEKYYTEQFLLLQPDVHGLISGVVAKGFFEKSKLPSSELREIWQYSDFTRDGALNLAEFKMAMHLVVLRRHGLPIPSHYLQEFSVGVPGSSCLLLNSSQVLKVQKGPASTIKNSTNNSIPPQIQTKPIPCIPTTVSKPRGGPPLPLEPSKLAKRASKEWTTFENEPVNFSSACDISGLVAPVPVRLKTPEEPKLSTTNKVECSSASKPQPKLQLKSIQRPKHSGQPLKLSCGTIAPPPPPRRKTHIRSSSLDLNRLTISSELKGTRASSKGGGGGGGGPEVPARSFLSPSHQGGAFSVYRKPGGSMSRGGTIHEPSTTTTPQSKGGLVSQVSELKNENEILNKISSMLLDELSELEAKRKGLGYKIGQLTGRVSGSGPSTSQGCVGGALPRFS